MINFTSDQWVIVALVFVLGLLVGGFLFTGGGRKWKHRYNAEVDRRKELEREHASATPCRSARKGMARAGQPARRRARQGPRPRRRSTTGVTAIASTTAIDRDRRRRSTTAGEV